MVILELKELNVKELPKECGRCPFYKDDMDICVISRIPLEDAYMQGIRDENCPIISIKEV